MIINANDKYIGRSIELHGSWAADDIELIKSIVDILLEDRKQVCFYDVGANIGTHSVALARHFGPKITIRAFEAQRQIYYMLCGNVALNGLDNVICEHVAVAERATTLTVTLPDYGQVNNFGGLELIPPSHSDNDTMIHQGTEQVPTVTLDQYQDRVDLIKLDVEGMEHLVLAGAANLFQQHRPVCFFEVLKTDVTVVQQFFADQRYTLYQLRADDWIAVPVESDVELDLPKVLQ
jgi:FkbM family methyltransferase